jgi:hypothetical protein
MKIKDIAKNVRELLQGGCGWVVLYKVGRSWEYLDTFCYGNATNNYEWTFDNEEQRKEFLHILEVDPDAIILNGFSLDMVDDDTSMSIETLTEELKDAYLLDEHLKLSKYKEDILEAKVTDYYAQPYELEEEAEEAEEEENENEIAFKEMQRIIGLTAEVLAIAEKYRTIWDDVQTEEEFNTAAEFENEFATHTMVKYLNELECYSPAQREFADKFFMITRTYDNGYYVEVSCECHLTFDEILTIIQEHIECFADSLDYEELQSVWEVG